MLALIICLLVLGYAYTFILECKLRVNKLSTTHNSGNAVNAWLQKTPSQHCFCDTLDLGYKHSKGQTK
jgi:hypothetical protein